MKLANELWIGIWATIAAILAVSLAPSRRGLLGFVSAVIVGSLIGIGAGVLASEFGMHRGWQLLLAAFLAIVGDRFVYAIIILARRWSQDPEAGLNSGLSFAQRLMRLVRGLDSPSGSYLPPRSGPNHGERDDPEM